MTNHKSVSWVIGVLIVVVISLFVFVAPANAGVNPAIGRDIHEGDFVIIGETTLNLFNLTEGVILSDWADSHIVIPFSGLFDSSRYEDELVPGKYKVENATESHTIFFVSPKLDIKTEVEGEEFEWVTRGGDIVFEADTNLWIIEGASPPNYITYKLTDPRGDDLSIRNIDVGSDGLDIQKIATTGLEIGVYTLSIETDPATNNGLDIEGPELSFEVRSKGVIIEVDKEKQTVTEAIVFTISTTPHTNITLNVTWGRESKVTFGLGGTSAFGSSDKDGEFKTSATFADSGSYEITATEDIMGTTESIFVEIVPYIAEVETAEEVYHIGENIKITGSSTAGRSITLKIDDEVVAKGLDVEGFDYTWETEGKSPDSHKIAIWVEGPPGSTFSDPDTDPPDDSITILLLRGGLIATPSANFVALGDDFKIDGTVPGRDRVDIFTIAPDGGGGRGFDPTDIFDDIGLDAPGLTYETTGVDIDGEFETEDIGVGEDVDTGTYLIAVLNYGRDGSWGKSNSNNLLELISNNYAVQLGAKTTDQLLAILKDKTINAAGTDDLLGIATIKVEEGFVTLGELEDVPLGKEITVTGTTNRQEETPVIIRVEGLDETTPKLKPRIANVEEDDKAFYNRFGVSIDTASANIGRYRVTADDGDGHTATTTVNIIPAVEPSVNVSTTPTPKPEAEEPETEEETTPTAKPETATPTPGTEEPAEEPGFELLFACAGLLIAGAVLLRRQQKQRR